eukprot:scaffold1_cov375-Pavlova_lutheri.AAC.32
MAMKPWIFVALITIVAPFNTFVWCMKEDCEQNTYGPECYQCSYCAVGRCNDGRDGDGRCKEINVKPGCAFVENTIAIHPGSSVVISTYFYTKPNPQTRRKVSVSSDLHRKWVESLQRHGMSGLVLHDGLPSHLQAIFQQSCLRSIKVVLNNRSINDQRFALYKSLLKGEIRNEAGKPLQFLPLEGAASVRLLFTDMFDVEFYKNPFKIMYGLKYELYVGSQLGQWNRWMIARGNACKLRIKNKHSRFYNAGIFGGSTREVFRLLDCYTTVAKSLPRRATKRNCNMPIFSTCLMQEFPPTRIYTGSPFHSKFQLFEGNISNIYIRHK